MTSPQAWGADDAARGVTPPREEDHKYTRGVLGAIVGSTRFPGAAVLVAEAALHTGLGMLRVLAPAPVAGRVVDRRPEVVIEAGRVQAWLIGSGCDEAALADADRRAEVDAALSGGEPLILDASAIGRAPDGRGPVIVTPHAGELAQLLSTSRAAVEADPVGHGIAAADVLGAAVIVKGHTTRVAGAGRVIEVSHATPWLATAGSGDALAGVLGALVATRAARGTVTVDDLVALGASASWIHGEAARRASRGGPFTVLELCRHLPGVVADLINRRETSLSPQ